jgi:hypothetical protein
MHPVVSTYSYIITTQQPNNTQYHTNVNRKYLTYGHLCKIFRPSLSHRQAIKHTKSKNSELLNIMNQYKIFYNDFENKIYKNLEYFKNRLIIFSVHNLVHNSFKSIFKSLCNRHNSVVWTLYSRIFVRHLYD